MVNISPAYNRIWLTRFASPAPLPYCPSPQPEKEGDCGMWSQPSPTPSINSGGGQWAPVRARDEWRRGDVGQRKGGREDEGGRRRKSFYFFWGVLSFCMPRILSSSSDTKSYGKRRGTNRNEELPQPSMVFTLWLVWHYYVVPSGTDLMS